MIHIAVEPWSLAWPDMQPLWQSHFEELSATRKTPLDVDHETFAALEKVNALHVVMARREDVVVGYWVGVIHRPLHYRAQKVCHSDAFFVSPQYRGAIGTRLLVFAMRDLKARGIDYVFLNHKVHQTERADARSLFRYLGGKPFEEVYSVDLEAFRR